jgi:hypothetical protein
LEAGCSRSSFADDSTLADIDPLPFLVCALLIEIFSGAQYAALRILGESFCIFHRKVTANLQSARTHPPGIRQESG